MENESINYDPTGLPSVEEMTAQIEEDAEKKQVIQESEAASVAADEQAADIAADPRNNDTWGIRGIAKEAQSILSGGLQDTASSLATFPERTFDALSGEMQKEKEEKGFYEPEWTPFTDEDDPIITKTWWGKLLRGTVHFGSLAAGTVLAAKRTCSYRCTSYSRWCC